MPIPSGVSRIEFVGHAMAGEIFATGHWVATAPNDEASANTFATNIAASLASTGVLAQMKTLITNDCGYDEVRIYAYPAGGPRATVVGSAIIPGGVGSGTQPNALQVAMCCTLQTGIAGRRNRGRMYLPANTYDNVMGPDHAFQNGRVDSVAAALAAYFSFYASDSRAAVLSQVTGTLHPITAVKIDNRPDIQRRRANRQGSSHVKTSPVTT